MKEVESVFSSLKQRIKIFFYLISRSNPVRNWNLFCKLFMLYYSRLRWCFVLSGHVYFINSKYDKPPYTGKYRSEYGEYIDREIEEKK